MPYTIVGDGRSTSYVLTEDDKEEIAEVVVNTTAVATTTTNGLMSAEDKSNLDSMANALLVLATPLTTAEIETATPLS